MRRKTNDEWLQEVQDLVGDSYVFLQPYKNTRTKLYYYHVDCGEVHSIKPDQFLRGHRCPNCSRIKRNLTLTKDNDEWLQQVKELTGDEYVFLEPYKGGHTPIEFWHRVCKKKLTIEPANFLAGHRCSYCANKYQDDLIFRERVKNMYGTEYKVLSTYDGSSKPIHIQHKCGFDWWPVANNFIQGRSHCPKCQESQGEREVSQILDKLHVKYIQQYIFEGCRYKRALPFDFYLPDYNLIIEYDGRQHFAKNEFFNPHDPFEERQLKDHIKNEYCKNNGINLLRIPYNHTKTLEDIIIKRLNGIKHNK